MPHDVRVFDPAIVVHEVCVDEEQGDSSLLEAGATPDTAKSAALHVHGIG